MEGPERRRPPTVSDIARRVGVSTAAVSYALSGRPGVRDHTRRRVRAVADEMGWVPHPAVRYLAGLGHGRLAYLSGPPGMRYLTGRIRAFAGACRRHAVKRSVVAAGNDRGENAARITRRLLSRPRRPTAVIYNNDVMALAGLAVATELGLDVPAELSIVSWEDSSLLRHTYPPVATISRDVASRASERPGAAGGARRRTGRGRMLEPVRLVPDRSVGRLHR